MTAGGKGAEAAEGQARGQTLQKGAKVVGSRQGTEVVGEEGTEAVGDRWEVGGCRNGQRLQRHRHCQGAHCRGNKCWRVVNGKIYKFSMYRI